MKEVTTANVQERISQLEHDKHDIDGGLSIRSEFELAYLRELSALQQKMDAMTAENAVLKDINAWCHTEAFQNMYREFKTAEAIGCPDVDCMHDAMLVAIMHAPPTPATDAYLNSVRADAVETFAVELAHRVHRSEYSKYFEDEAIKFAAKLRLEQEETPHNEVSEAIRLMGFVEWLGDENLSKKPEHNLAIVKVILRDGSMMTDKVKNLAWQHDGDWDDIIAYRVCE